MTAVAGALTGRRVLVTGGGSGIGRAVALGAARAAARVVVAGRRLDALHETRDEARAENLEMDVISADVTDTSSVDRLVAASREVLGGLDGLVNAAGIASIQRSEDVTDEEFLRVLDVNLIGAFRLSRAAGRHMLSCGRGSIVHIGSLTSAGGFPGRTAYAVSKHGVLGLTRSLASEWGSSGVRVNAVVPGFVRTPMTDRAFARGLLDLGAIESRTPLRRRAEPAEIVGPVLFLLSDAASFVTGECLVADGGWLSYVGPVNEFADARSADANGPAHAQAPADPPVERQNLAMPS
jgi:NAD(P)-dependent dehydrogenase (short-subunit alcohol dehydrogenase family)